MQRRSSQLKTQLLQLQKKKTFKKLRLTAWNSNPDLCQNGYSAITNWASNLLGAVHYLGS